MTDTAAPLGQRLARARMRWRLGLMASVYPLLARRQRARIRANLDLAMPHLSPEARAQIEGGALDNLARTLAEFTSMRLFVRSQRALRVEGPGLDILQEARSRGQGAIVATGHIANYLACIQALANHGVPTGLLHRQRGTRLADWWFDRTMRATAQPTFKIGHRRARGYQPGLGELITHLRTGGTVGALLDQRVPTGISLPFLGRPALTTLSAAKLARRHGALLMPGRAIRQPDGHSFRVFLDEPIPLGPESEMMVAFNDRISAWIAEHPEQWFWTLRRW